MSSNPIQELLDVGVDTRPPRLNPAYSPGCGSSKNVSTVLLSHGGSPLSQSQLFTLLSWLPAQIILSVTAYPSPSRYCFLQLLWSMIERGATYRLLKQSPDANENITSTTSPHFPSWLDVNTPFVHLDINQSARSTESPRHYYNSQIWRIQEETQKLRKRKLNYCSGSQASSLRRKHLSVPRMGKRLWRTDRRPSCTLQLQALLFRRIHVWSSAKNDQRFARIANWRRLQESKKSTERTPLKSL